MKGGAGMKQRLKTDPKPIRTAETAGVDTPSVRPSEPTAVSASSSLLSVPGSQRIHEFVLLMLFLCGMLCCLITGFSMPVYPSVIAAGLPAVSLLAQHLIPAAGRRFLSVGRCILAGISLLWFYLRTEQILLGLQYAVTIVLTHLCRGFPGLTMPTPFIEYAQYLQNAETNDLLYTAIRAPLSESFLFAALIFGLIWVFFYRILGTAWLCAALPLPAFILCFLIIEATIPALWALFCLLLYWVLILFTRASVSLHARAVSSQISFLLLPCLLFLLAVYALYPRTTPVGELVQNGYDRVLNTLSKIETTVSDMANGLFSGGWFTVSPEGDTISFAGLKPRRFLGRTVMQAKCDTTGVVYLREKTYGDYTSSGWVQASPERDAFFQIYSELPTLSAQILENSGTAVSHLSLEGARSSHLFTPYYFSDSTVRHQFQGDRFISNPDHIEDYEISFYRFSGDFGDLPGTASAKMLEIMIPEYTEIDPTLAAQLLIMLKKNGISAADQGPHYINSAAEIKLITDYDAVWETVAQITRFVRSSAKYSLNADVNTTGQDFVIWFLEEAEYGYCTHFATAEVMLLRACGIPARLAAGYLCSIRTPNKWTPIKDSGAHAWVEVFDERLGWIPVEATPPTELSDDMDDDRIIVGMTPIAGDTVPTPAVTEAPPETTAVTESETEAIPPSPDTEAPSEQTQHTVTDDVPGEIGDDSSGGNGEHSGRGGISATLLRTCGTVLLILLSAVSLILILLWIRSTRYTRILHLSHPLPDERNTCALRLYRRCTAIAREHGTTLPTALTSCAEKARFSQHTLTEEEFDMIRVYYQAQCEDMKNADRPLRRLRHYWIDVYY